MSPPLNPDDNCRNDHKNTEPEAVGTWSEGWISRARGLAAFAGVVAGLVAFGIGFELHRPILLHVYAGFLFEV
jgi:hypothetical protein